MGDKIFGRSAPKVTAVAPAAPPPPPPPAPLPDEEALKKARQKRIAREQQRAGSRLSTVLSDTSEQRLGG